MITAAEIHAEYPSLLISEAAQYAQVVNFVQSKNGELLSLDDITLVLFGYDKSLSFGLHILPNLVELGYLQVEEKDGWGFDRKLHITAVLRKK